MKAICLLLLLLTGCASHVWYQPGKSALDAQRDLGQCRVEASRVPVVTGSNMNGLGVFMSSQMAAGNYIEARMMSMGYQVVKQSAVTNGTEWPRK